MPLSFLAPLFLAGLAALAIPILVHLMHRERKEAIVFPSLMFLRRIPYRTVRRQRIRHWLLFLLRSAAIVTLVAAFARPLFDSSGAGGIGLGGAREIVIMLDRSYSMAYGDRWQRALDAARSVADRLGPEDRATVLVFSDRAEALNSATGDPAIVRAAIDQARLSAGTTRYGPPLQLAGQIFEDSRLPDREAVLITDFQKSGWDDQDAVRLPAGVVLTRVDVADPEHSNVTITAVTLERVYRAGRERAAVSARLANQGQEQVSNLTVHLEIDGQQLGAESVDLTANSSATVRFSEFALPRRAVRGVVRTVEDALPLDNVFRFVLSPGRALSVLVLEHSAARPNESLYLSRALLIGSDPPYRVDVKRVTQFGSTDLDGRSAVILNDAPFPRGAVGRRLREFVSGGGGLLVVLGQHSSPGAWPVEASALLPGTVGAPVDRFTDRGGTLNVTDYDHPIFELFNAPRSGDFSQARFFRYRRLDDGGTASVLARFDDGSIALAEMPVDSGSVLVWTSGLTNSWNDFPLQPVFLPFIHRLVRHLASYVPREPWFTVGQVVDLSQYAQALTSGVDVLEPGRENDDEIELVVEPPSGSRHVIRLAAESRYLTLEEQGFYEIRPLDGGNRPVGIVAVNLDIAESDLTALDPEELAGSVTFGGSGGVEEHLAATLTPVERERRQGLWWYLLVAVLLLLVAETVISNRVSKASRPD